MYLIIVGAGDIATPLIDIATNDRNEVAVIERDEQRAERAAKRFDCLVINDDATTQETLEEAGADRADGLISTTNRDATNVMVCLLAQELAVPSILSVVHDPEHISLFERIGVNSFQNPERLIAEHLYRAVRRPAIKDYMRIGEQAEVFEIVVDDDAPIAGTSLTEADQAGLLPVEMLVVAIEREGSEGPIMPRGRTTIEVGDLVTIYSASGVTDDVTDVFGYFEDRD